MSTATETTVREWEKIKEGITQPVIDAVIVITSVFSQQPFYEVWQTGNVILGEDILCNKSVCRNLVSLLVNEGIPSKLEPIGEDYFLEEWEVSKEVFIDAINSSQKEIGQTNSNLNKLLQSLKDSVSEEEGDTIKIQTTYPLTELIETYSNDAKDGNSFVVGLYKQSNNKDVTIQPLSSGEENIDAIAIARIRDITRDPQGKIIEEIKNYLKPDIQATVKEWVEKIISRENTGVMWLGEIAKLKETSEMATLKVAMEFFKTFKDKLPSQMFYLTLDTTVVSNKGLATIGNIALERMGIQGKEYIEEKFEIYDRKGRKGYVSVLTLKQLNEEDE